MVAMKRVVLEDISFGGKDLVGDNDSLHLDLAFDLTLLAVVENHDDDDDNDLNCY